MDFSTIRGELTEFPGLPQAKADRWILEALQEICRATWAYTEVLAFLTTAGTVQYTLSPSSASTIPIGILDDGVEFCTVDTPAPAIANGTAVGTLTPAATYYYKVTALTDDYGETLPCAAVSKVCPASGSLTLTWAAIDEADGYRIYQSTTGAAGTYYKLDDVTSGVTYTDDGSDTADATVTPPSTSNLMQAITLSNIKEERWRDRAWKTFEGDGIDRICYLDGYNSIRLNVIPETSNMGFQVTVALYPTAEIAIPNHFIQYKEAIKDYVKSEIYRHPNTSVMVWNNPDLWKYFRGNYETVKRLLKIQKTREYGGKSRLKIPFFA